MRLRWLLAAVLAILAVIAAVADCGGHEQPYQIDTDAGCLSYSGSGDYCNLSPYACDASPDVEDLASTSLVRCDNPP